MSTNRSMGGFLGAVVGACLGSPYIFMKSGDISRDDAGWRLSAPGIEMELAFAGMRSFARHGVDMDALARAYSSVIRDGVHDLDVVSATIFGENATMASELRRRAQESEFGTLCSNALLIRQIPLVIAGRSWDIPTLCGEISREGRMTHSDDRVIECAQLYAMVLQGAINRMTRLEIRDRCFEVVRDPENYRMLVSSYYETPRADGDDYNAVCVATQMALYHFWHDTPFVSALKNAIRAGGATDIKAAATGALLGAMHGVRAIPSTWREELSAVNAEGSWQKRCRVALGRVCRMVEEETPGHMVWRSRRYSDRPLRRASRVKRELI